MVPFRLDRQQAGRRPVELRWWICKSCRHVGLNDWRFVDTHPPDPQIEVERVPRRTGSAARVTDKRRSYQEAGFGRK
jgi:hypothetical protein